MATRSVLKTAFVLAASVMTAAGSALGQSFDVITAPPGQGIRARGISSDGTTVAGELTGLVNAPLAFRWTRAGGRVDLGTAQGFGIGTATGLSGDGTTLVGRPGFRYRGPGTFQSLGTLGPYPSAWANGVNGDGNVVVGEAFGAGSLGEAWRWTPSGGMQGLGRTRAGHTYSSAQAVSRDGNVVVGASGGSGANNEAFAWTPSNGMRVLPDLPGSLFGSGALATNHDGSYIAGTSGAAVIWHNFGAPTELPTPSGWGNLVPHGISDDGTVVAGVAQNPNVEQEAWIWTQSRGSESLMAYLISQGVQVPAGWRLHECMGVSADGRTFIGVGGAPGTSDSGAFVATVPMPGAFAAVCAALLATSRRKRRAAAT